jgi:hypothetical protein
MLSGQNGSRSLCFMTCAFLANLGNADSVSLAKYILVFMDID